ncbi:mucin-13 [Sorex fumeus]|uniref:mucin-13 n=1 Tax=Sorex fumeus TaxID=62283 RepID=UPI0024ADF240|nr:mucin-13 [Sorex fumeus]
MLGEEQEVTRGAEGRGTINSTSPTTATTITSNTTGDSTTTSAEVSNTTVSAKPTTTGPYNICLKSNCTGGSSCVGLNTTFFCICQEGYYYKQSKCLEGRVFPGTLTIEQLYTSDLEDKGSMTYEEYHYNITKFFKGAFNESVYGQTVIHKVSLSTSEKSNSRVKVTVVNILNKDFNLTEEEVTKAIRIQAVKICVIIITVYGIKTTVLTVRNVFANQECTGLPHKPLIVFTQQPEESRLQVTESGNQRKRQESGLARSNRNFQLILTIVGSIAGICILGLMIAMIFMGVRSRSRQENTDQQKMVEYDSQDMAMQHTGFSGPYTEGSRFPKAQTTPSSQPHNPYK